jgi:hypothetical protein
MNTLSSDVLRLIGSNLTPKVSTRNGSTRLWIHMSHVMIVSSINRSYVHVQEHVIHYH